MDNENEVDAIREQMKETRSSLVEKVETLEQKVTGTVEGVTHTVENVRDAVKETVETVKESIGETVETVKETFNLRRQMDRHPWLVLGGSVAAGYLLGTFLGGPRSERRAAPRTPAPPPPTRARTTLDLAGLRTYPPEGRDVVRETAPPSPPAPAERGWLAKLGDAVAPEVNKVKAMAIGTVLGLVRDAVTRSVPQEMGSKLADAIDNITRKAGGEPVDAGTLHGLFQGSPRGEGHEREHGAFGTAAGPGHMPAGSTPRL